MIKEEEMLILAIKILSQRNLRRMLWNTRFRGLNRKSLSSYDDNGKYSNKRNSAKVLQNKVLNNMHCSFFLVGSKTI